MPVITLYRHGAVMGTRPSINNHVRALRGLCEGWTNSATRSNRNFLYSVDESKLSGFGFALSLTIKYCPPDSASWRSIRFAFVKRLRRLGMVRMHWLTEWQRRGVPHLHAAVWFSEAPSDLINKIRSHWIAVADRYSPYQRAQYVVPISDSVGWFKYLSKHAVRGLNHYQRSAANIPAGWKGKTGRMWGKLGEWTVQDSIKQELYPLEFYRLRRIFRAWRKSDARQEMKKQVSKIRFITLSELPLLKSHPDMLDALIRERMREQNVFRRITSARQMLRCSDRSLSSVRGCAEWVPIDVQLDALAIVKAL